MVMVTSKKLQVMSVQCRAVQRGSGQMKERRKEGD